MLLRLGLGVSRVLVGGCSATLEVRSEVIDPLRKYWELFSWVEVFLLLPTMEFNTIPVVKKTSPHQALYILR